MEVKPPASLRSLSLDAPLCRFPATAHAAQLQATLAPRAPTSVQTTQPRDATLTSPAEARSMRLPEAGLSQRAFERTASGGLLAGVVAPMRYGVKDVDYTPDPRGNPILTQHGKADTLIPWQYITQPPNALYIPTAPEYPQVMQAAEKALLPFAQIDPTATLYSDTFASKGTGLAQLLWSAAQPRFSGRVALLVRHRDG